MTLSLLLKVDVTVGSSWCGCEWWTSQSMTCISIFPLPARWGRKGGKVTSEGQGNSPGWWHLVSRRHGKDKKRWPGAVNLLDMSYLLVYKPLEELPLEHFWGSLAPPASLNWVSTPGTGSRHLLICNRRGSWPSGFCFSLCLASVHQLDHKILAEGGSCNSNPLGWNL